VGRAGRARRRNVRAFFPASSAFARPCVFCLSGAWALPVCRPSVPGLSAANGRSRGTTVRCGSAVSIAQCVRASRLWCGQQHAAHPVWSTALAERLLSVGRGGPRCRHTPPRAVKRHVGEGTFTRVNATPTSRRGAQRPNPTRRKTPRAYERKSKLLPAPRQQAKAPAARTGKNQDEQKHTENADGWHAHNRPAGSVSPSTHPRRRPRQLSRQRRNDVRDPRRRHGRHAPSTSTCCRTATDQTCCPWSCPGAAGTCGPHHT